jgi:hypothetical protein
VRRAVGLLERCSWGIIDNDAESFRVLDRDWKPTLPGRADDFGLADNPHSVGREQVTAPGGVRSP